MNHYIDEERVIYEINDNDWDSGRDYGLACSIVRNAPSVDAVPIDDIKRVIDKIHKLECIYQRTEYEWPIQCCEVAVQSLLDEKHTINPPPEKSMIYKGYDIDYIPEKRKYEITYEQEAFECNTIEEAKAVIDEWIALAR